MNYEKKLFSVITVALLFTSLFTVTVASFTSKTENKEDLGPKEILPQNKIDSGANINSIELQPNATEGRDAFISNYTDRTNKNFGQGDYLISGNYEGGQYRSLLKFDIPSKTARLHRATLSLMSDDHTGNPNIVIKAIDHDWDEGTGPGSGTVDMAVNWTHRTAADPWNERGGDYNDTDHAYRNCDIDGIWYTWDVTEIVKHWETGTWENNGFLLMPMEYLASNNWARFYSSDYTEPKVRPKITLSYSAEIDPAVTPQTIEEDSPANNISLDGRGHEMLVHLSGNEDQGNAWPFGGGSGASEIHFQTVYSLEQIGTGGMIDRISFNRTDPSLTSSKWTGNFSKLEISFAHTELSNLTSTFSDNYIGGLVEVFKADNMELNSSNDDTWLHFDLNNNFTYDSSYNLLIDIKWNGSSGDSIFTWNTEYSAGSIKRAYSFDLGDTSASNVGHIKPVLRFETEIINNFTHVSGPEYDTNWWPFYGTIGTDEGHYQSLYTPEQVGAEGKITRISLKKLNLDDSGNFYNFRISLAHSDLTNLTTTFVNNYNGYLIEVFSTDHLVISSSTDDPWIHFDLNNNFTYDLAHNLLVDIKWKGGDANIPTYVSGDFSENRRAWDTNLTADTGSVDGLQSVIKFETEIMHDSVVDKGRFSNYWPFAPEEVNEMRCQMLYNHTLLKEKGVLDKIAFQAYQGSVDWAVVENLSIRLSHSTNDSLSEFFDTHNSEPWTEVFNKSSYNVSTIGRPEWIEIDIDNTFTYNGKDNLLIEIRWIGGYGSDSQGVNLNVNDSAAYFSRVATSDYSAQTGINSRTLYNLRATFLHQKGYSWNAFSMNNTLFTAGVSGDWLNGWDLHIQPQPDAFGSGIATLQLHNSQGKIAVQHIPVTINNVNDPPNQPSSPSPSEGATGIETEVNLSAVVSDPDGDVLDITFYDASDDSVIGTDMCVSCGEPSNVTWSGLSFNTTYEWYVVANDTNTETQSPTWSFTTLTPNYPPDEPTNPSPADGATGIGTNPTLSVEVSDPNGDVVDVMFYNASDDSLIGTDSGVLSGGTASITWSGLDFETNYQWYAVANDSILENQSVTWSFTTGVMENNAPNALEDPSPPDEAVNVSISPVLSVNVSDPDGDSMNVTFYNASDDSLIGTDLDVSSGGTASVTWPGLSGNTTYQWYAVANDSVSENQSSTWSFTTLKPNHPPEEPINPSPVDNATGLGTNPTLRVEVSDPDGDSMNVTFYNASDDSLIGIDTGVFSGEFASVSWPGLAFETTYHWYAVANDSALENHSQTWTFTTGVIANNPPSIPSGPSPSDGSTGVSTNPTLSVEVSDPDGDTMDVTFYNASDDSIIGIDTEVESGGTASVTWYGLNFETSYLWYTVANDSALENQSQTWSFTTSAPNHPPEEPINPTPSNDSSDISTDPTLSVEVSDLDGDTMDVTFYNGSDDSVIGVDTGVMSGGTASVTWSGLSFDSTYHWYVVVNDSELDNISSTWSFTTSAPNNPPEEPINPSPSDGAIDIGTSPRLIVEVSDPDGDAMDVTFYDASDDSVIGTDSEVMSGGTASVTWTGLSRGTSYEWYVIADDGLDDTESATWTFSTEEPINNPPDDPTDPSISDGKKNVGTSPKLSMVVSDPDGGSLTVTFYDASDDSVIGTDTVQSGGTASVKWEDLKRGKTYRWYVEVSDGDDTTTSDTLSFKTKEKDEEMFGIGMIWWYLIIAVIIILVLVILFAAMRKKERPEEHEEEFEEEGKYEPPEGEEDMFADEEEEEGLFSDEEFEEYEEEG